MYVNTTNEEETAGTESNVALTIIIGIIAMCFYVLGIYLHAKIIIICKKEKEVTWKLNIANSVFVIATFTYNILLRLSIYMIPDLYLVTGEWFCYTSKVVIHYSMLYNVGHSMVISLMKYIVIVHDERIRPYKQHVLETFFWMNMLHPAISIIFHVVVIPEFYVVYGGFRQVNSCFGNPQLNSSNLFSVCDIIEPPTDDTLSYSIYIIKWLLCNLQALVNYLIAFNAFDILIYCKIFAYGKRQGILMIITVIFKLTKF